jgi:hypothetical protein
VQHLHDRPLAADLGDGQLRGTLKALGEIHDLAAWVVMDRVRALRMAPRSEGLPNTILRCIERFVSEPLPVKVTNLRRRNGFGAGTSETDKSRYVQPTPVLKF